MDKGSFGQVIIAWLSISLFTGILGEEKDAYTQYSGFGTCTVLNAEEKSRGY